MANNTGVFFNINDNDGIPLVGVSTDGRVLINHLYGNCLIGSTSITGTTVQPLQVTGGAYVSGSVGIGTTNPQAELSVIGNGNFTGVVTATSFFGSGENLTGISSSKSRVVRSASTGSIGAGSAVNLNIQGYKTYSLLKVGITSAAWVVLYTDSTSRTNDQTRNYLTDPLPGSGVIAEVRTTSSGISTFIMSPGIIGWNDDSPTSNTIYARVTNNESSSANITVNLTVLQLED